MQKKMGYLPSLVLSSISHDPSARTLNQDQAIPKMANTTVHSETIHSPPSLYGV